MATHFLRPLLRPTYVPLALTGLGVTAYSSMATRRVHRLDTLDNPRPFYGKDRLVKEGGGLDAKTVRQISQGAVGGLLAGLAVSVFSRTLAVVIGVLIIQLYYLSKISINLPYSKIQHYISTKTADLRTNPAFKLSFGTTFAMAAFLKF